MRKIFKKFTAITLSATLVAGMAGAISAAVATGTDVSAGKGWASYSIHTREDKGKWEDSLKKDGQVYAINVPENSKIDSHKTYGENAKITSQTPSSFNMNIVSTGWSAKWAPIPGQKDKEGKPVWGVRTSNPWGVTATKIVNVERGRYYTIAFKIKSTLKSELTEEKQRKDGTYYNVGTGKYNYVKRIHVKAYDDKDKDGKALTLSNMSATIGGKSVLIKGNKTLNADFDSFITLDSKNTADDGWVSVTANVLLPSDKSDYQGKAKTPTMGIQFAFGTFLKEFKNENNMSGTIQVKDFTVKAGTIVNKPAKVKGLKVTAKKKSMIVKFKKASKAKKYEITYSKKSNFKGAKTKTTSKTKMTIKKLSSKKKYYVKVRAFYTENGSRICGAYSAKKAVKIK